MDAYLFSGVVLPERAQLMLNNEHRFTHLGLGVSGSLKISIIYNQVAVWVTSEEHDWDIFDLRNMVKTSVQNQIALAGYLLGYAYDLEITRVLHLTKQIDYVFGIDIPSLASRNNGADIQALFTNLHRKTVGINGVFLHRCFTDLSFAMRHSDDTGFYCYRAIESLFHHCAAVHNLGGSSKTVRWVKFRELACCDEETLYFIKGAADPLRHGNVVDASYIDRDLLFTATWNVVDGYLNALPDY